MRVPDRGGPCGRRRRGGGVVLLRLPGRSAAVASDGDVLRGAAERGPDGAAGRATPIAPPSCHVEPVSKLQDMEDETQMMVLAPASLAAADVPTCCYMLPIIEPVCGRLGSTQAYRVFSIVIQLSMDFPVSFGFGQMGMGVNGEGGEWVSVNWVWV